MPQYNPQRLGTGSGHVKGGRKGCCPRGQRDRNKRHKHTHLFVSDAQRRTEHGDGLCKQYLGCLWGVTVI